MVEKSRIIISTKEKTNAFIIVIKEALPWKPTA